LLLKSVTFIVRLQWMQSYSEDDNDKYSKTKSVRPSVRPSVNLSHSGIVLNGGTYRQNLTRSGRHMILIL